MPEVDLATSIHQWANDILVWIGFGTVVGLLAKAIMPGRDPGGAIATTLMGIGGTVLGCGAMALVFEGQRVTPLSPLGFAAATARRLHHSGVLQAPGGLLDRGRRRGPRSGRVRPTTAVAAAIYVTVDDE